MCTKEKPKPSKSAVKKAAELLINDQISLEEKIKAYHILANFRSSHTYPMQSMAKFFKIKASSIDSKAIVVQRLKRIPSILAKLKREKAMKVKTMGDIGGIRIIVSDIKKAYQLQKAILESSTKNKLFRKKDYIETPNKWGYRSLHLCYKYQASMQEYQGLRIELQIRSKIQHAWATAVEVIGTYHQQNLKAGRGNKKWLAFFQHVSQGFECLEKHNEIPQQLKSKINHMEKELKVIDKLKSFSVISHKINIKQNTLLLLYLDIKSKTIRVETFEKLFFNHAYERCRHLENEIAEDNSKDVVLVFSNSIQELKVAYPNYFADTKHFISLQTKIFN